jgi:hypothetical protein
VVQAVEHLPSKSKALISNPSTTKKKKKKEEEEEEFLLINKLSILKCDLRGKALF